MQIKIKKLSENGIIPTNNGGKEAGYDLYSVTDGWLRPLERSLFQTDIAMEIPEGYYGRIADRSGNAYKLGLHCLAGVIDSSYRGNIGVILYNTNGGGDENSIKITKGQKIAQIIFEKCHYVEFLEKNVLTESERGNKGYGSSDTNYK
jgi:dUTP pyrophosphatase